MDDSQPTSDPDDALPEAPQVEPNAEPPGRVANLLARSEAVAQPLFESVRASPARP